VGKETAKSKYLVCCEFCEKKLIILYESCPLRILHYKTCPVCHCMGRITVVKDWTDEDKMNVWTINLEKEIKKHEKSR